MLSLFKKKRKIDSYWIQKVPITRIEDRRDLFFPVAKGKKVIHFGCTDYPIFRPEQNLHIELSKQAAVLHGFDIDLAGIAKLKEYVDQPFFSNINDVKDQEYDLCLIPETIEHVNNIQQFLSDLQYVNAKTFIITGPNCFCKTHIELQKNALKNSVYEEVIHPDHNCWFSPFTLKNVVEKYTQLKVSDMYLLEQDRMVCCVAVK